MEAVDNRKAEELNTNRDALKMRLRFIDGLKNSLLQTTSRQSGICFPFLSHHSKLILIILVFSTQTLASALTCLILPFQEL